eukprot:scaffold108140_cov36-Prasinocladus_malaysianus.AAC.1
MMRACNPCMFRITQAAGPLFLTTSYRLALQVVVCGGRWSIAANAWVCGGSIGIAQLCAGASDQSCVHVNGYK